YQQPPPPSYMTYSGHHHPSQMSIPFAHHMAPPSTSLPYPPNQLLNVCIESCGCGSVRLWDIPLDSLDQRIFGLEDFQPGSLILGSKFSALSIKMSLYENR